MLLAWVFVLGFLVRQGGMCQSSTRTIVWMIIGMATAQLGAGLQAADHMTMQVPLSCNKQHIESTFRLIEKGFRDEGAQTWLLEHAPPMPHSHSHCLLPGARLQLFIEKSSAYDNILPGQSFRAKLRLKPPRAPLQLEGFDVHRYWFASRIAGTAQLKSGIELIDSGLSMNPVFIMERLRLNIANWIVTTLRSHPEQALILAMVVGDQGLISSSRAHGNLAEQNRMVGAQHGAAGMLFAQPRQYLWITLHEVVEIVPERREDDDIGIVQAAVDRQLDIAEAVHGLAVRAHQANFEHGLQAQAQLLAVTQAGEVEEILGLHQGRSEHLVNGQDADAPQRRGGLGKHHCHCSYRVEWSITGWIVLFFGDCVYPM